MKYQITRNRKGVLHVNGTPIRVPKNACFTDKDVLEYAEMLAQRAPGCLWDVSMLEIGSLNRVVKAKGITP